MRASVFLCLVMLAGCDPSDRLADRNSADFTLHSSCLTTATLIAQGISKYEDYKSFEKTCRDVGVELKP